MSGWNNEDTHNAAVKTLGQDYDLYQGGMAAAPWAKIGSEKLGMGEGVMRDLVMVLQALAGIENGGVAMSQNLRAGVMRGGISGIAPNGDIGMINGYDVVSAQAANAMQQSVMRNFTNPVTGLPNRRAQGLDQAELGRLGGYMLGQGMGVANGPLQQSEIMTRELIEARRKEIMTMPAGTERGGKLRELDQMKPGQLALTDTANMGKFTKMMEEGATTLKAIKDVFGSSALKDLDDTFQQLLGGSLAETGPRAARARMMGIKSMGNTFFGGDMQAAGTYSLGNQRGLASSIGGQFGIDPATAKEMFGAFAASVATQMDMGGLVGSQTQTRNSATAGKYGISTRVAGAGEVAAGDQRDVSAILAENPEMIALAHMAQTNEGTMTKEQQKEVQSVFEQMKTARTEEQRNALITRSASLGEKLSGRSTGEYLHQYGGTAQALSDVRGKWLQELSTSTGSLTQNAHEEYVKSRYATDLQLRGSMGMNSEQMGAYGIGTANLTDTQFQKVEAALANTDPEARRKALSEIGLGSGYEAMLNSEAGKTRGANDPSMLSQLNQIRVKANQYSENYKSADQIQEGKMQAYQKMVQLNQISDAKNPEDFSTGLIRGLWGGKLATSKDAIGSAKELGLETRTLTTDKNKLIEGTDANIAALSAHFGDKKLAEMGLSDPETMRKYLQDAGNQTNLMHDIAASGGYAYGDGKVTLMDEKNVKKGISDLEYKAKINLLKQTGMVDAEKKYKQEEYERKDGETDEEYEKNKSEFDEKKEKEWASKLKFQVSEMEERSWNGKGPKVKEKSWVEGGGWLPKRPWEKDEYERSWTEMDDFMKKYMEGDEDAIAKYKAMEKAGVTDSATVKTKLRDSIKNAEGVLNKTKKAGAKGMGVDEETFNQSVFDQTARLDELKQSLNGKDASIVSNSANITVNGDVTVTGKEKA